MKRSLYLALTILILVLPGPILLNSCSAPVPTTEAARAARAAIVDQLYSLEPNPTFINNATATLGKSGFQVDVFRGDDITVDFYRRLPTLGYGFIIFRSHSGLQTGSAHLSSGDMTVKRTYLFTNELYSETKHIGDQLSDCLTRVKIDEKHPWVFAISPDFVRRSMQGNFDRTFIVMMGCSTLSIDDLARSFIEKGASAYTGWDASVGLDYVDNVTTTLLEKIVTDEVTVEVAVRDTMQIKSTDPNWGARLKYYPNTSGTKTLADLLK